MKFHNFLIVAMFAPALACEAAAESSNGLPAYRPKLDASIDFPAPKHAARKAGAFVPAHNVAMVTPGMKKSQIYTLLDVPHFHEGFNVKRWNYILNFYTGAGNDYRPCQYQIRFDAKARVEETYFQDADCGRLLDKLLTASPAALPPAVTSVPPVSVDATPAERLPAKTFDFTFAFNSSVIDAQGWEILRKAADEIGTGDYREVIITGFTDSVGSTSYNDALAARRAAAAAELLRTLAREIPVYARASRDLEVPTQTQVREERNRRVQIELYKTKTERPTPILNR